MIIESTGTPILYLGFTLLVAALLAVDIFALKTRGTQRVSVKEAAVWSIVWIVVSLVFCAWFWWYLDGRFPREAANEKALEYLTGYLIEKSLAVDNVFVWIVNQRAKLTRKPRESASKFDHPGICNHPDFYVWSNLECYAWKPSARSGAASW